MTFRKDYVITKLCTDSTAEKVLALCTKRNLRLDWYFVFTDLITSRMRSSAYIGCECRKGLCSRLQCRLTGYCTMMPLSTYVSSHQSPTSRPDKDFGLPLRTICVFLLSDCLYCWTSCFLCCWLACLERSSCRRHFSPFSVHFPKTFKTASLFALVSWPGLLN